MKKKHKTSDAEKPEARVTEMWRHTADVMKARSAAPSQPVEVSGGTGYWCAMCQSWVSPLTVHIHFYHGTPDFLTYKSV